MIGTNEQLFDSTRCARCDGIFGLALGEVSRSECKDLCVECYTAECYRMAVEQAIENGEACINCGASPEEAKTKDCNLIMDGDYPAGRESHAFRALIDLEDVA